MNACFLFPFFRFHVLPRSTFLVDFCLPLRCVFPAFLPPNQLATDICDREEGRACVFVVCTCRFHTRSRAICTSLFFAPRHGAHKQNTHNAPAFDPPQSPEPPLVSRPPKSAAAPDTRPPWTFRAPSPPQKPSGCRRHRLGSFQSLSRQARAVAAPQKTKALLQPPLPKAAHIYNTQIALVF